MTRSMTRSHVLTIGALTLVGLMAPLLCANGAVAATLTRSSTFGVSYRAMDLGPGAASDVNDLGQVVGTSASHAVLWNGATVRDLGTLPAPYDSSSSAVAINDLGQIIGNSDDSQFHTHAFIWRNGVMTDLGTLGGPTTRATAINDLGEVVGYSNTATIAYYHNGIPVYVFDAFLWRNGQIIDLGTLGGQGSVATDINEFGHVAGQLDLGPPQAAIWKNGQWAVLEGLSAGDQTEAVAINDFGQVLGIDDSASYTPLLWTAGHITNLATACPGLGSIVMDLNDLDWIVGAEQDPGHVPAFGGPGWFDPVICRAGAVTFLPPLPGSADNMPSRMNNLGAVAGYANFEGGAVHAVLWRPSF
jgi:probable HAF family extracellular repeat protein